MKPLTLEDLLFLLVAEIPTSEFNKACSKAELTRDQIRLVLNELAERGI